MIRLTLLFSGIIVLSGCANSDNTQRLSGADYQPDCMPSVSVQVADVSNQQELISEPNDLLTLRDALRLTLMRSPELEAYSYEVRAAEGRLLQAGLWQNPELDIEVENFGGTGPRSGFDGAETTIQLSQLIELGGKIDKRKRAASFDSRLAGADYDAKRLDISTALTKSYISLLLIQEKESLWDEFVQVSGQIVDSVEKRVQAGKDSPIDLSKSQIGLAKIELQQIEIMKYKQAFRTQLASYWDSQSPMFTSLAGRLDEVTPPPELADVQGLLKNNPDLIQRAIQVQKRQTELSLAQAQSIGDIKVAGGVKYFDGDNDTAFVMGLSIPLGISDRNQGGRIAAMGNYRKAQAMEKVTALSVRNEINRIYADLEAAHKKAIILRDQVLTPSEELFDASKIAYERGKKDYLALLDSQRTYFSAKNEYLDALAEYHMSKTELERLIGRNLQDVN